jgi:uncharacterized protein YfiM (DUF2279 family)
MRGADIPPLDEVVESFSINSEQVVARLKLSPPTGLVDRVNAGGSGISPELVEAVLCRIAAQQRTDPVQDFAALVRRTFAGMPEGNASDYNRASFVALSLAVVGEKAEPLIAGGAQVRKKCSFAKRRLRLQGRGDLAKHWSLSAALASVIGGPAAGSLGEWKELDDSRPGGSGFSFVDLAADRAGVHIALLAVAPQTTMATREKLAQATDDYMLPEPLLLAPEALSDASFIERFGSLDEEAYREAVSHIDMLLAQQLH